jgi:signal transduction histidine kinase
MRSIPAIAASGIPLLAVVTTRELRMRPSRAPDFEAENGALKDLAHAFMGAPQAILQKLADVALRLCKAHSAGVTMLEQNNGEPVFRWCALAGKLAPHFGKTMPRAFSPCGMVIDHNALQLMTRPVRHFSCIKTLSPSIEEALLVPFYLNREPVGTIWVVAHDRARHFDSEDARLITSIGQFAAAACEASQVVNGLRVEVGETESAATAANRHKDRFIAMLAHELRGQLAPAKTAIELLTTDTLNATQTRWARGVIGRHVDAMTRLVEELLDAARLANGKLQVRRRTVAVADIVAQSAEAVRPAMTAREHEFVVRVPPEPIFIDADPLWLAQALQNLLGNAAKCANAGGRIECTVQRDGDEVVFTVSDNGVGIAPEKIDQIFGLYVQGGSAQEILSGSGLGIGLYLTRLVIEAHGGTVRAVSAGRGFGSQFIVRMPCKLR